MRINLGAQDIIKFISPRSFSVSNCISLIGGARYLSGAYVVDHHFLTRSISGFSRPATIEVMSLFSLDILEPSLTKRPSTPPRIPLQNLSSTSTVLPSTPSKSQPKQLEELSPPRWNTPEFYFYAFAFFIVVPQMVWCAYDVSRGWNPWE